MIVASSTDEIDSTLRESRTLIIASALAAALLVVPIAFVLTGRALRPLAALAAGAEVIERRGDPSLRLPAAGGEPRPRRGGPAGGHAEPDAGRARARPRGRAALRRRRLHELRNPLAALRGNAEYLARHGADTEPWPTCARTPSG